MTKESIKIKKPTLSRSMNIVIALLALVRTGITMWDWIINPGLFSLQLVIITVLTVFIVAYAQHWIATFILVKAYNFIKKRGTAEVVTSGNN